MKSFKDLCDEVRNDPMYKYYKIGLDNITESNRRMKTYPKKKKRNKRSIINADKRRFNRRVLR